MDMLRLDSQRENVPSFLLALCFNKLLTAVLEFSYKKRLPSFGTPDEMIDNEMDSVFIPLLFKLALACRFHLDNIQQNRQTVNRLLAKATDKPAYPRGINPQRLAAGSFVSARQNKSHQSTDWSIFTIWVHVCRT